MRTFILLLTLLAAAARAQTGQIALEGNTDSLEVITSAAGSVDYHVAWSNVTATALTTPGTGNGNITTATTTSVVAAPSASNWRYVRSLSLYNASTTASNTVTVQVDRSASNRVLCKATLAPGGRLMMDATGTCKRFGPSGEELVASTYTTANNGLSLYWNKTATATDATGYWYGYYKDSGNPGAWSPGTPGLNGVFTDCSAVSNTSPAGASQMGSPYLPDATGQWYLTKFGINAAIADGYRLIDVLWYNTGLVVTTTTAQTVTWPGTIPARDQNGSSNGDGLAIALYTTTANTNAATISNTTVSYTNSQGTAGRTATFFALAGFQAPATPVIGTWMEFQLQSGDTGVQSVQSVTLGTSYGAGALSLILYQPLQTEGVATANGASGSLVSGASQFPGVRIANGACLGIIRVGSAATTASGIFGATALLMDR